MSKFDAHSIRDVHHHHWDLPLICKYLILAAWIAAKNSNADVEIKDRRRRRKGVGRSEASRLEEEAFAPAKSWRLDKLISILDHILSGNEEEEDGEGTGGGAQLNQNEHPELEEVRKMVQLHVNSDSKEESLTQKRKKNSCSSQRREGGGEEVEKEVKRRRRRRRRRSPSTGHKRSKAGMAKQNERAPLGVITEVDEEEEKQQQQEDDQEEECDDCDVDDGDDDDDERQELERSSLAWDLVEFNPDARVDMDFPSLEADPATPSCSLMSESTVSHVSFVSSEASLPQTPVYNHSEDVSSQCSSSRSQSASSSTTTSSFSAVSWSTQATLNANHQPKSRTNGDPSTRRSHISSDTPSFSSSSLLPLFWDTNKGHGSQLEILTQIGVLEQTGLFIRQSSSTSKVNRSRSEYKCGFDSTFANQIANSINFPLWGFL